MPLKSFPGSGILLCPHFNTTNFKSATSVTINAAGESKSAIGYIYLQNGASGGSKTISSAGGKIHWRTASPITFADPATNLRVGIQDVSVATGLEDGTHDVYADLVGGTDVIAATSMISTPMETGSKTIAHGDAIAVTVEMTARGGTDAVVVQSMQSDGLMQPFGTTDAGTLAVSALILYATIEFDDGTLGWFHPYHCLPGAAIIGTSVSTFHVDSTPDERALIFKLPFDARISGAYAVLSSIADTDDLEIILYSNPLGVPVAERTFTFDASFSSRTASTAVNCIFSSPLKVRKNITYAIAVRPTTINPIATAEYPFGSESNAMKSTSLGQNWYLGTRTNQTGAFDITTTTIPNMGIWIDQFHDGQVSDYLPT